MIPLFDRDLSWLSFNQRVMDEAKDQSLPLLERLRFIAIYSSNLDEFFRVRVADIRNFIRVDKKKINDQLDFNPSQILADIQQQVGVQLKDFGQAFEDVIAELKNTGIHLHLDGSFPEVLRTEVEHYFRTRLAAYLQPVLVLPGDQPFLHNQGLYFAVRFADEQIAILNIPSDKSPRFFKATIKDDVHYIFIDDIIRAHLATIFPDQPVKECMAIKLNKDADLGIEDEFSGDLVKKIEKQILKRDLGKPSRFLFDQRCSKQFLNRLVDILELKEDDLMPGGRYHNMYDLFQVANPGRPELEYPPMDPIWHPQLGRSANLFSAIERQDRLLHFPYHSYDYILHFFNEASLDPEVQEINVTFYRMAEASLIGEALISAAQNGKKVFVFMEVKARFDEANNLHWARRMEEAGIRIVYSLPGLKVHAKAALVKKEDVQYAFLGTGNLNEKTARIYSDFGLLTADRSITKELSALFKFLYRKKQPDDFNQLIVSQFNAIPRFTELIDREIQHAQTSGNGQLTIKINNLQEKELINKLYEAASSGVQVNLIVRSICCLVPGTHGIRVKRVVDRFLEHARMFHFHNNGNDEVYLGSSDWMNRNLHRRVEVTFPIREEDLKQQIITILGFHLHDNQKAVWLDAGLQNTSASNNEPPVRAQSDTYSYLKNQ